MAEDVAVFLLPPLDDDGSIEIGGYRVLEFVAVPFFGSGAGGFVGFCTIGCGECGV